MFFLFLLLSSPMLLHPLRFVVPSSPHYIQFALIAIRLTEYVKKPVVSPDNSSILFRVFALFFFNIVNEMNHKNATWSILPILRRLLFSSFLFTIMFMFPEKSLPPPPPPSHAFNFNTLLVVPNFTSPSFGISLSSQSKIQRWIIIIWRVRVWWIVHVPTIKLHAAQWKWTIDWFCVSNFLTASSVAKEGAQIDVHINRIDKLLFAFVAFV